MELAAGPGVRLPSFRKGLTAGRSGLAAIVLAAQVLVGCATSKPEPSDVRAVQPIPPDTTAGAAPTDLTSSESGTPAGAQAFRQVGTGDFLDRSGRFLPDASVEQVDTNEYSVNLVDVPIAQAADAILGDTLGLTYALAPQVQGTITLLTSNPLKRGDLLETFNTVLELNGLILKLENDVYVIEPATANVGMPRFRVARGPGPAENAVYVLPMKYISAAEMIRILEPIASPSVTLGSNAQRNLLFAGGSGADIEAIIDAVNLFDIDVLKGKSVSLVKLRNSDPAQVATELEQVFDAYQGGALDGVLRFLPNQALSAILIMSTQPAYIRRAEVWIQRYEAAGSDGHSAAVYRIENRTAVELAPVLSELLSAGVAAVSTSDGTEGLSLPDPAANAGGPLVGQPAKIVADDISNTIIAYATGPEHEEIRQLIKRLDDVAYQVLLEATIAEVRLTDDLAFGVRWFFESGDYDVSFSGLESSPVTPAPIFPGFNAILSSSNVRVALDALATVTDLNVISSPSLLVLDNRQAVLSVGDQIPIATQSVVNTSDPDAPIVNSITQESTGVILKIRPRVSSSGRVVLDIDQEVSDAVATETSGIDSPTIQQRIITTTVAVDDGQSVALGGLIREVRNRTRGQVPILGDIPLIGTMFRNTKDTDERTELLVIITPKLIRDASQARQATDEFRNELSGPSDLINAAPRTAPHRFKRIFF